MLNENRLCQKELAGWFCLCLRVMAEFVLVNYAYTNPRLRQLDWSKQNQNTPLTQILGSLLLDFRGLV